MHVAKATLTASAISTRPDELTAPTPDLPEMWNTGRETSSPTTEDRMTTRVVPNARRATRISSPAAYAARGPDSRAKLLRKHRPMGIIRVVDAAPGIGVSAWTLIGGRADFAPDVSDRCGHIASLHKETGCPGGTFTSPVSVRCSRDPRSTAG